MCYRSIGMNLLALSFTHLLAVLVAKRRAPRAIPVVITLVVTIGVISVFIIDTLCNVVLVNQLGLNTELYTSTFGKVRLKFAYY